MIYELAGLRILIKNKYPFTTKFCERYLSKDQDSAVAFAVEASKEEIAAEKRSSNGFSDGYLENICLYRNICERLPALNRLLLHCSVLEYDGNGYAFLGRSGTGKSTHTRLWLKHLSPTRVINGDKPILQYEEGGFIAYGTPWMGKEQWGTKADVPLKGLCFLAQAKKNEIRKLTPKQAAGLIFSQILFPKDEENAAATLELADKIVTKIPCYLLQCDISKEAVKTSFEEMTGLCFEEKRNQNQGERYED